MKKTSYQEFMAVLDDNKKQNILRHFNTIYECNELGEHELNIAYLAWLWKEGYVYVDESGMSYYAEEETGMDCMAFEITIESEDSGGVNLDIMHDFYRFYKLMELL